MNLSPRLRCIADMVSGVDVLADIGSDHAYLPICLLKEKKIKAAIITDLGIGPLSSAKNNVEEAFVEDFCSIRLGNGLDPLEPGEASCIVIAGMGGNLISQILNRGFKVAKAADYLILQAMQHTVQLRDFLNTNYYKIIEERVVFDAGKYYEIIKVAPGEQRRFNRIELEIGYAMVRDEVYFNFLDKKTRQLKRIIDARKKSNSQIDIKDYIEILNGIEKRMYGDQ